MTETLARPTQVLPITTLASVDITIPVLNEERAITSSLSTLSSFLETECAYDWTITVADNGSTDATSELAASFAAKNPRTRVIRLDQRGRGRALKEAWSTSTADVVAYMDVDLSTGLDSLQPLIDPILDGRCEVSIGSRLLPGAEIARSMKRELISRTYNAIARNALRYNVADAQCGFKAVRASVFRQLLSSIVDNEWFFDTELLALAHRHGLRINEVPVRWVDDDDSRVRIAKTASEDLKGIWRVRRAAPNSPSSVADRRSGLVVRLAGRGTRAPGRVRSVRETVREFCRPVGLIHRSGLGILRSAQGRDPRRYRSPRPGFAAGTESSRCWLRYGDDRSVPCAKSSESSRRRHLRGDAGQGRAECTQGHRIRTTTVRTFPSTRGRSMWWWRSASSTMCRFRCGVSSFRTWSGSFVREAWWRSSSTILSTRSPGTRSTRASSMRMPCYSRRESPLPCCRLPPM